MDDNANMLPESLSYLPAFFRAEIEPLDVIAHHPIRWLLQVFETNLHLAERIVEASKMLFDPEEFPLLPDKVCPAKLLAQDITDLRAFASKLKQASGPEPSDTHLGIDGSEKVSHYLWGKISEVSQQRLLDYDPSGGDPGPLRDALIKDLNTVMRDESIYDPLRFAQVKFSESTRSLLKQNPSGDALIRMNRLLLEDAYPSEISALPEFSLLNLKNWKMDYIHWLASWVGVSLDEEWFDETSEHANRRYRKACTVIKNAAWLYRERGTRNGLEKMIALFYDFDVEIVERSWPRGVEIGVSSEIGLNCWLVDEIDLDRQFTVLIRSTERNRSRVPEVGLPIVSQVVGPKKMRQIVWLSMDPTAQPASDPGPSERFAATVNKLRALIDREKPVHTRYYLGFEPSEAPGKQLHLGPLVIGVDSRIEDFWIN